MKKDFFGAWRELGKDAYRIFSDGGARVLSGSIAFYALLSVVPILVIALRLASVFVDPAHVDSAAFEQLSRFVGARGAQTVIGLALETEKRTDTTLTNLLGIAVLIYGSTRLFSQMTRALDLLWGTEPTRSGAGLLVRAREQVQKRALSFAMVLAVGVLLVGTVLTHAALATARHWVGFDVSFASRLLEGLASFAATVALFALIFRVLPRGRVNSADALVGGAVTALLFTLGSLGITAYVTHKDMSVYGTASALVMLMLWANYSAHVFFLGAAFTAAHARRRVAP